MPLVGAGIFSSWDPGRLLGSLAGHLVYGGVVGWYYGRASGSLGLGQSVAHGVDVGGHHEHLGLR